MASSRQITANRLNAQRSTGPRTASGKAVVAHNALKHGLLARQVVLPDEDAGAYTALQGELEMRLVPGGVLEQLCVERLAAIAWRLRRIPAMEAGLLLTGRPTEAEQRALEQDGALAATGRLGMAFAKRAGQLNLLGRYEAMLERRFYRELRELGRLRMQSAAEAVMVAVNEGGDGPERTSPGEEQDIEVVQRTTKQTQSSN